MVDVQTTTTYTNSSQCLHHDKLEVYDFLPYEDTLGLENCVYQQIQQSADSLLPLDSHSQPEKDICLTEEILKDFDPINDGRAFEKQ